MNVQGDGIAGQYSAVAEDESRESKVREAAMLLSVAEGHLAHEDEYLDALSTANEALAIYRQLNDRVGVADSMRIVIASIRLDGRPDDALDMAQQELATCEELNDLRGQALMLLSIAETCADKMGAAKRQDALDAATKSLEIFEELGDKNMLAVNNLVVFNIRILLLNKNREIAVELSINAHRGTSERKEANQRIAELKKQGGTEAEAAATAARDLFQELGDKKGEAKALYGIALSRATGGHDEWVTAAKESIALFQQLDLRKFEVMVMHMVAQWYFLSKKYDDALWAAQDALSTSKEIRQGGVWSASAVKIIVRIHLASDDFKSATKFLESELELLTEVDDRVGMAAVYDMLISLNHAKDDRRAALQNAENALMLVRGICDKSWEASMLQSVATVHIDNKKWEPAMQALQRAVASYKVIGDSFGEAGALHKLTVVHMARQDAPAAMRAALKEQAIYQRMDFISGEASVLMNIYQIKMMDNKPDEALEAVTEAARLYSDCGEIHRSASMTVLSAMPYLRKNDMDKALAAAQEGLATSRQCGGAMAEELALSIIQEIEGEDDEEEEVVVERRVKKKPEYEQVVQEEAAAPTQAASAAQEAEGPEEVGLDLDMVMDQISAIARNVADTDELVVDTPLMDMGIDSLSAISFRNDLSSSFGGMKMPGTVVFDFPTVRAMAEDIVEKSKEQGISGRSLKNK